MRNPTVSATPIAPIRLSVGVPSSSVNATASQVLISNDSSNATSGDRINRGRPVTTQ
ncbi:hypothetical protein D3C78_1682090 [compost metagenome]